MHGSPTMAISWPAFFGLTQRNLAKSWHHQSKPGHNSPSFNIYEKLPTRSRLTFFNLTFPPVQRHLRLLAELSWGSILSKPPTQPNIILSWVRHENDFAHPTTPPHSTPQKLNVSNISVVTEPILMKL